MNELIYSNLSYLKRKEPKYSNLLIIATFLIIIFIILSMCIKTYTSINKIGYLECLDTCNIKITTSLEETESLNNIQEIKIDNNTYQVLETTISEILTNEETKSNYQIIDIKFNKTDIKDKMFYNINLYHTKESILIKLLKYIKE